MSAVLETDVTGAQPQRRETLPLDDTGLLWWIDAGTVDVFAVRAGDSATPGAREHLYRLQAGQPCFGAAAATLPAGWRLLGVPGPQALLRPLHWVDVEGAPAQPPPGADLAAGVASWVEAVARGTQRGLQPRQYMPLHPGATQALEAGQAFFPAVPLVFVRLLEGEASLLGEEPARLEAGAPLLPVRDDSWLVARTECRVQVLELQEALAEADLWQGLRAWHGLALGIVLRHIGAASAAELARMQARSGNAARQLERGLDAFARTLADDATAAFADLAPEPLLACCQLIGRRMGIEFRAPPRSGVDRADPVEEIATAARVRFRQVALRGDWWTADGGDLLGKLQDSKQPVALLRTSGGYEMHDPAARTVTPVDEAVATTLVPFAQSFFPALPGRPLRWQDLAAFALRSVRGDVRRVLGLGLLIGLLGMLIPVVTGHVFDAVIPASDRSQLTQAAGALLALALATGLFSIARSLALLRLESRMDAMLQAALWDRALNLPVPFFRRFSSGDLAQRLAAVSAIRQALSGTTLSTLLSSVFSLASIALLLYYDLWLGALAVLLLAGAALLTLGMGWFKLRHDRQLTEVQGRLSGLVLEYLRGVVKLRVTGAESRAFANWAAGFARLRRLAVGSGRIANLNEVFFTFYQLLADMALFAAAAWLLQKALVGAAGPLPPGVEAPVAMTTGQFIAFLGAFGQVLGSVVGLAGTALTILALVPTWERLQPVLDAQPETDLGKSHPGELAGRLDVVNLTFRYQGEGPPVLDNVSFSVRPGGFVAVVGPSGSGKSTLLRCLLGFERPQSGGVFYDNQNLADLDARAVRRQLGVVLQHSQVMPGDIFTNIVGTLQLGIDDAWEAARFCGLEDDIKAMPMGMHTVISEGGNTLSGGQRQRILIARAIVQRPRLLLFDEATSALDNRTQEVVTRSLDELRATRIVIAHRLSTILRADQILVMDQGRIVQRGNYRELMEQPGLFQELARRQLS